MWLSSKGQQYHKEEESDAQLGEVTVAGQSPAVFLSGERRRLQSVSPGGYYWRPRERDTALVIKTGEEGASCLLGAAQNAPDWLAPGEIWLSVAEESGIWLKADGSIRLVGMIFANGTLLSAPPVEEGEA